MVHILLCLQVKIGAQPLLEDPRSTFLAYFHSDIRVTHIIDVHCMKMIQGKIDHGVQQKLTRQEFILKEIGDFVETNVLRIQ